METFRSLRPVDIQSADFSTYTVHLADCIVVTHDYKLLLQERSLERGAMTGSLTAFGGHVEAGESILEGLVRELHEELGAVVDPHEVVFIGAVTEEETNYTEVVHVFFWQDKRATITGCYECIAKEYDSLHDALQHPKILEYLSWALNEASKRGLLDIHASTKKRVTLNDGV